MKLNDDVRIRIFEKGRALSQDLGDMFQNPMEFGMDDLNAEIDRARAAQRAAVKQHQEYIGLLGQMLCFPEMEIKP